MKLTRIVVDSPVLVLDSGATMTTIRHLAISIALMAFLLLVQEILRSLSGYISTAQSELVKDYISDLTHKKSTNIDLEFFDSPDYYDRLHRALYESGTRPLSLIESTGRILQNGIRLLAMAAVLVSYAW